MFRSAHLENVFGHGGCAVGTHEGEEVEGGVVELHSTQRAQLMKLPELSACMHACVVTGQYWSGMLL